MPDSLELQPVTATQLAQQQRGGALILDTRPAEQFATLHIRGSIQISLMGNFASWAAIILDPEQKLLPDCRRSKRRSRSLQPFGESGPSGRDRILLRGRK